MHKIKELYKKLCQKYGVPKGQWILWCKRPKTIKEKEEVMIGAVLTQRANWNNVDKAIDNLKNARLCSLRGIYNLAKNDKEKLFLLIRPSGFYKQKAERLFILSRIVLEKYKNIKGMGKRDVAKLREEMLGLKGLGEETVDDILLYSLEKPVFVIDEYTRRFVKRHNLCDNLSYKFLQGFFESNMTRDYKLYQDFHALIIIDGKTPPGQRLLF